ncbi:flagellin FliC, partial [bacterium]|nr:flagellin FliC [bacterium]
MAPITIGSNVQSINTQRYLDSSSSALAKVYQRLSSGRRINTAADDPAGLTIADRLLSDQKVASVAIRNINDGISLIAIADGALEQIGNVLSRLGELAEQSANGVYSTSQRSALSGEFASLSSEIERIAAATVYNGFGLISGGNAIALQVGFDSKQTSQITIQSLTGTLEGLGLGDSSSVQIYSLNGPDAITGASASRLALDAVNRAIGSLTFLRGNLGSGESRLRLAIANLSSTRENFAAAEGRIRDADVASDSAELTRLNILQQAGASVLA